MWVDKFAGGAHKNTKYISVFGCEMILLQQGKVKVNVSNPVTSLDKPWGFQEDEAPRFQDNRHMMVVRLLALRTGHLYPQEYFWYSLLLDWVNPRTIVALVGNRTRDLPTCNAVPKPTAPPRAPKGKYKVTKNLK